MLLTMEPFHQVLIYLFFCVCTYVWRSETNLCKSVLFCHLGSKDQTQIFRLGSKCLYRISHLVSGEWILLEKILCTCKGTCLCEGVHLCGSAFWVSMWIIAYAGIVLCARCVHVCKYIYHPRDACCTRLLMTGSSLVFSWPAPSASGMGCGLAWPCSPESLHWIGNIPTNF